MVKHITATLFLGTLLFSLPVLVLAENATTTKTRTNALNRLEEIRPKIDARLASTTKKIEENKAKLDTRLASATLRINIQKERLDDRIASTTKRIEEQRERLDERRKENVRRFSKYMTERFGAAIERIERLIERIEERIAKWKEGGKNVTTTEAERYLGEAKTSLSMAKVSLNNLKIKIEEMLAAESPQTLMPEIRTLSETTVADIKKSHGLVIQAIRSLKSATSTNQN